MNKLFYQLTLVWLLFAVNPIPLSAQTMVADSLNPDSLSHCSLFYLQSFNPQILPFDDACFVRDRYQMHDYHHIRVFGPIEESHDLFRKYGWSMNFYLGEVSGDGKLDLVQPKNWLAPGEDLKQGQFFFFLSDDRQAQEFGRASDKVDFVPVSGKVKVTDFQPQTAVTEYPYFSVYLDVMVQQVDRTGGGARLVGPEVRLKAVLQVQENPRN
jgi:hypothetical protein